MDHDEAEEDYDDDGLICASCLFQQYFSYIKIMV